MSIPEDSTIEEGAVNIGYTFSASKGRTFDRFKQEELKELMQADSPMLYLKSYLSFRLLRHLLNRDTTQQVHRVTIFRRAVQTVITNNRQKKQLMRYSAMVKYI